eukprot:364986-Chlamydomonas_euryale.AAC.3
MTIVPQHAPKIYPGIHGGLKWSKSGLCMHAVLSYEGARQQHAPCACRSVSLSHLTPNAQHASTHAARIRLSLPPDAQRPTCVYACGSHSPLPPT